MPTYADLEIAIRKKDERSYALSMRFNGPEDDAEQRADPDPVVEFDAAAIRQFDPDAYGTLLTKALFTAEVKNWFGRFRTASQTQNAILRVRLTIEPSAPELHALRWETMRDPDVADAPLFMGEQTIASRFLASGTDWRPIRVRAKSKLKALAAIANPGSSEEGPLEAIDFAAEKAFVEETLGNGVELDVLGDGGPLALNDLAAKLRDGYDILYLICHGILDKQGEPYICLEEGAKTRGVDLVQRVRELDQRPRLIVLASCQSAGKRGVALSGLGPRLAEAGVPAVIAMQGSVGMGTAAAFMKRFFLELLRDGQADRAMSIARGEVRKQEDYWMPALFLRLKTGRIWYEPGFEGTRSDFEQWQSICKFVRRGACVPVIGPDVAEHVVGGTRAIAAELAQAVQYPMDSHDGTDLAKVAQFALTQHSPEYARETVLDKMFAHVKSAGNQMVGPGAEDLPDLVDRIADRVAADAEDPLAIVAKLNAKVFVNASADSMLERVLARTKFNGSLKVPKPLVTEWRDERRDDESGKQFQPEGTAGAPYIYYVFGKALQESSWVLTEDDFFDYLIRTTRYQLMPMVVSDALLTGSLLFLGFPLDDWKFRVLFRMILAKGGHRLLQGFNHVGVQLDPSEAGVANARRAKRYLERYFLNSKIDIYWGTSADFLRELKRQLETLPAESTGAAAGGRGRV